MVIRKTNAIAFLGILITAGLVVFFTQVQAQTLDQQKEALIGEWNGTWPPFHMASSTLIIHEIDVANGKARCTYWYSGRNKWYPVLANFTPGPNPKLEFKMEMTDHEFVLKNKILEGTSRGINVAGKTVDTTIKMEKKPKE